MERRMAGVPVRVLRKECYRGKKGECGSWRSRCWKTLEAGQGNESPLFMLSSTAAVLHGICRPCDEACEPRLFE